MIAKCKGTGDLSIEKKISDTNTACREYLVIKYVFNCLLRVSKVLKMILHPT